MARTKRIPKRMPVEPEEQQIQLPAQGHGHYLETGEANITSSQIRAMTVIQLRAFMGERQPQFDDLMEVYNRSELQEKLIRRLGLT